MNEPAVRRCFWVAAAPGHYVDYHDREWGFPVADDRRLFEKLCLEGFQAGLSWLTILNKREHFRAAFADFDFARVARFGERDVQRLLGDAGIVRHRGKIEATIANARAACELVEREGSLAAYVWRYEAAADRGGAARDGNLPRVGSAVEGPEAPRLPLRRTDDLLRVHAGDGARQRPRRGLRGARAGDGGAQGVSRVGVANDSPALMAGRSDRLLIDAK